MAPTVKVLELNGSSQRVNKFTNTKFCENPFTDYVVTCRQERTMEHGEANGGINF
jgi:hypothetical protein